MDIPGVKGLVNFAGGVKESDCSKPDESLIETARQFGAKTKVPSIWIYGENDSIFSTPTWRGMYQQYTAAGAKATLIDYGNFMKDAHTLTGNGAGLPLWVSKVDAFLAGLSLPSNGVNSEFMPAPSPPESGYAALDDIDAVPFLTTAQAWCS